MGIYDEYLGMQMGLPELNKLRWEQLERISALRGRPCLAYAADFRKGPKGAPISIDFGDIVPFHDRLQGLPDGPIDLILETPGGSGEVAEDLVRMTRDKASDFAVIVPGWAKSAGTIMAMAADDILMGTTSALGPIDAQLTWQGKVFSADSLIKGFDDIKEDVDSSGVLSRAYIPMLQNLSPGELKEAHNQLEFARSLVTDWLVRYKFKNWTTHQSSGAAVTPGEREERARQVAEGLCDHERWHTHGKSLRIADLEALRLKITDYTAEPELNDAITRYYTLLEMLFDTTTIYKLWEVPGSWIVRHSSPAQNAVPAQIAPSDAKKAAVDIVCPKCGNTMKVQANLDEPQPLDAGMIGYPSGDKLKCSSCATEIDLTDARRQVELVTKKSVVPF